MTTSAMQRYTALLWSWHDHICDQMPTIATTGWSWRLLLLTVLVLVLGLPLHHPVEILLLALGLMAVIFLPLQHRQRNIMLLCALIIIGKLLVLALPVTQIKTGYQPILPQPGYQLEQLPPVFRAHVLAIFDRLYPPDQRCDHKQPGCWMFTSPEMAPAFSANGIWSNLNDGHLARDMVVADPGRLQLGFVNQIRYNWYEGVSEIAREQMPYYLVYTLPPQTAGVCFSGTIGVQFAPPAAFAMLTNKTYGCTSAGQDWQKIYVAWWGNSDVAPRTSIALDKGLLPTTMDWLGLVLPWLLAVVLLAQAFIWRVAALPVAVIAGGLAYVLIINPMLWLGMPVMYGGADGLVHEGYARLMLQALLAGDWREALRGNEDIFYFMPGLRYFRVLERLVFGEAHYGYLLVLLFMPFLLLALLRTITHSNRWCLFGLLAIFSAPAMAHLGWHISVYTFLTGWGLAEPLGYSAFLGALLLCARLPLTAQIAPALTAGLLLAVAIAMRPNLVLASGLLVLVTTLFCWRQNRMVIAALLFGFLFWLALPLHNYVYGGSLVWLTSAAAVPANLLTPPATWLSALGAAATGNFAATEIAKILGQIDSWIGLTPADRTWIPTLDLQRYSPHVLLLRVAVLLLCALTLWQALRQRWRDALFWQLILLVPALHAPLLVSHPDGRYSMLAWLITSLATWRGALLLPADHGIKKLFYRIGKKLRPVQ